MISENKLITDLKKINKTKYKPLLNDKTFINSNGSFEYLLVKNYRKRNTLNNHIEEDTSLRNTNSNLKVQFMKQSCKSRLIHEI